MTETEKNHGKDRAMTQKADNATVPLDEQELRGLVAEALELPVGEVADDAAFVDDLEVDSLMTLEIMVRVEQRYGVEIDDDEFANVRTFSDVRELVSEKLAAAK
jgi:acyl carrier protein